MAETGVSSAACPSAAGMFKGVWSWLRARVRMMMMWAGHCAPLDLTWQRLAWACEGASEPFTRDQVEAAGAPAVFAHSSALALRISLPPFSSLSVCLSIHHRPPLYSSTANHHCQPPPPPPTSPSFAHIRISPLKRSSDHHQTSITPTRIALAHPPCIDHRRIHSPTARPPVKAFALFIHLTSITWPLDNTLQ